MAPHIYRMIGETCAAAGVDLGAFDRRILSWLSGWEPATAVVICGLITRAHDAGFARGEVGPGQVMGGGGWISGSCHD